MDCLFPCFFTSIKNLLSKVTGRQGNVNAIIDSSFVGDRVTYAHRQYSHDRPHCLTSLVCGIGKIITI